MKYNPDIHHRRSIRLKGYDYSQPGLYFVTICTQDRLALFGDISNGMMELNNKGQMIAKWWNALKNKYQYIELHECVIMPNHIHGIIQILPPAPVGADQCVCPDQRVCPDDDKGQSHRIVPTNEMGKSTSFIGQSHRIALTNKTDGTNADIGQSHRIAPTVALPKMVQWFKTMTTNEYIRNVKQNGWLPLNHRLWQRNYYEHIIRDEQSYFKIAEYIRNNPLNWQDDSYYE